MRSIMKAKKREPVEYNLNLSCEINVDLLMIIEAACILKKAYISLLLKDKKFTILKYKACSDAYVDIQQALCSSLLSSPSGLYSLATDQTRGFYFN